MITIFTDGSARGNPGPGGWGAIVAGETRVIELGGSDAYTTNNKMELSAAINALRRIDETPEFQNQPITLLTDSEYVMKGITIWVHSWQKKGWRTAAKKAVLNQELWQDLIAVSEGKEITWKVVPGHFGIPANERCDEIATAFADGVDSNLFDGSKADYKISLKNEHGAFIN
jgi:ribonuclease HI